MASKTVLYIFLYTIIWFTKYWSLVFEYIGYQKSFMTVWRLILKVYLQVQLRWYWTQSKRISAPCSQNTRERALSKYFSLHSWHLFTWTFVVKSLKAVTKKPSGMSFTHKLYRSILSQRNVSNMQNQSCFNYVAEKLLPTPCLVGPFQYWETTKTYHGYDSTN